MADTPATGKTLEATVRYRLPIIFLPGIMGSRIIIRGVASDGSDVRWNPDSTSYMVKKWVTSSYTTNARYMNPVHPADIDPDDSHETANGLTASQWWGGISWKFYGSMIESLHKAANDKSRGSISNVYGCGYDWRKSNADSAKALKTRIGEVLAKETGAEKVILITHSMGGLVARSYLQQFGDSKVEAVIHITQPVHGGPKLYAAFKAGTDDSDLKAIAGITAFRQTYVLSAMTGAFQLLPNNKYTKANWLKERIWKMSGLKKTETTTPYSGANIYTEKYGAASGPYRLVHDDLLKDQAYAPIITNIGNNISNAEKFHAAIQTIFHKRTYNIASSGLSGTTTLTYDIGIIQNSYEVGKANTSDATVPLLSQLGYLLNGVKLPKNREHIVANVEHGAAPNNGGIITKTLEFIDIIAREYAARNTAGNPNPPPNTG
ncbi:MAG: alpha/beta hydrolase [Bacteroidetes Order II. Incertae sedis bacterium]|nr:alpha/beta hydrolase [Bacteroidetes Order II. bacterium]